MHQRQFEHYYNEKLIMNHSQFFQQGKWMPSFVFFGNREVIYHHPIQAEGQQSSIKRIALNPTYSAQRYLSQKLSGEAYSLSKNLKAFPQTSSGVKISHLRNMMQCVVKAADRGICSYHNILYLTFKYLACLVSKQATTKSISIEDEINIQNWLADIHSIYFQSQSQVKPMDSLDNEEQLIYLLKKGDYEGMISKLRYLYCLTASTDETTHEKIDLLLSILLVKQNCRANIDILAKFPEEQLKVLNQKLLHNTKDKFQKCAQKKPNQPKKGADVYTLLGKLLLGDESVNDKFSQKSWPLFLMNHILFGNQKHQKLTHQSVASNFIRKHNNYGNATQSQTEFLIGLLQGKSSHQIYQQLFQLVPPFYAHFIAHLLTIVQPNPIPNVFVEDYTLDIIRNLLDHASQISLVSLALLFANFEDNATDDKFNDIFETLLFHHLSVIDPSDRSEINQFLQKVKILSSLGLQRYAYSELNLLLNNQLQNGKINRQIMLIYAYCSALFSSFYNYEQLLAYHLQSIFQNHQLNTVFLQEYKCLKNELQSSRDKKLFKEIKKIEPLLDKFYKLQKALTDIDTEQQLNSLLELMQATYRSVSTLQIILDTIKRTFAPQVTKLSLSSPSTEHKWLLYEVAQFITHYPPQRGESQQRIIDQIVSMIS